MLVRLDMDLDYYVKRSLWLDVKIIFTTVAFIINGKKFKMNMIKKLLIKIFSCVLLLKSLLLKR